MRKNHNTVQMIASYAILIALTVVMALISNYITIGTVNINLALIPIVVGACLYGPVCGFLLGAVDGILILTAPSTASFLAFSLPFTILLCILKTGIAGMVAGFIYKPFRNSNPFLACILASLVVPIINTGIFLLGVFLFFLPLYQSWAGDGADVIAFVLSTTLTINFLIEFATNTILSPAVNTIVNIISKRFAPKKEVNEEVTKEIA